MVVMKVLLVLLSVCSAPALGSLEPQGYRSPGSSSSFSQRQQQQQQQQYLPPQHHPDDHQQQQQQQQQLNFQDQQLLEDPNSILSSFGASQQYIPPSGQQSFRPSDFSSGSQSQQYLPPPSNFQAPSVLAPSNFHDKPAEYLPPVASSPPPNDYLPPPAHKQRPAPPPKEYLPPTKRPTPPPPPPPSNEYLPPHHGGRPSPPTPSPPPKNDYLPPHHGGRPSPPPPPPPPKNDYLPPKTTTKRPTPPPKPPKKEYLPPPSSHHPQVFGQQPQGDYLPPRNDFRGSTSPPRTTASAYHADSQNYNQKPQHPGYGSGGPSLLASPGVKGQQPGDSYLPPSSGGGGGYQYDNFAGSNLLEQSTEAAKYEFEYRVSDEFGNDFGHQESREGAHTLGRYSVLLPDGRKQIVQYEADEEGFRPVIHYEEAATVLGPRTPPLRGDGYDANGLDSYRGSGPSSGPY